VGVALDCSGVEVNMAEVWNGNSPSLQATPDPSGAQASILIGVACTSASLCTAEGDYVTQSGLIVTLVEVEP
jgi:hypothetical protein